MDAVHTYLAALNKALAKGDATEHTHRPAFKDRTGSRGGFVAPVKFTALRDRLCI